VPPISALPIFLGHQTELNNSEIVLDPKGQSRIQGSRGFASRPQLLFQLLQPIAQFLPNKISFYGSDHDLGSTLLGDDQRQAAFEAIRNKMYLTDEDLSRHEQGIGRGKVKGTVAACPEGSLAWNQTLSQQEGAFIPVSESGMSIIDFRISLESISSRKEGEADIRSDVHSFFFSDIRLLLQPLPPPNPRIILIQFRSSVQTTPLIPMVQTTPITRYTHHPT